MSSDFDIDSYYGRPLECTYKTYQQFVDWVIQSKLQEVEDKEAAKEKRVRNKKAQRKYEEKMAAMPDEDF